MRTKPYGAFYILVDLVMVPKSDLSCINKLPLSVKIYDIVADYIRIMEVNP